MGKAKPKATKAKRSTTAPGQYLGFTTQATRFLVRLLEAQPGDSVCLDVFADVGVEKPDGTKVAEESKSNLATNPLSDRSVAFWKSIRNWVESIANGELDPATTQFNLFVTSAMPGPIAQSFHAAVTAEDGKMAFTKAMNDLKWTGANLADYAEELQPHLQVVFNAPSSKVGALVARFQILNGMGDALNRVRPLMLERHLVSDDACDDVVKWAHGWVKERLDRLLAQQLPVRVARQEFHNALLNYVRVHDRADILRSIAGLPSATVIQQELAFRVYVQQARLIALDDDMVLDAVNDFLAASADRTAWADEGLISEADLEEYSGELLKSWKNKKGTILIVHKEKGEVDKGKLLYFGCMELRGQVRGLETPAHFCRGSLHALAEDLTIGWHPSYTTTLKAAAPEPSTSVVS
jgi:hypothetical protein